MGKGGAVRLRATDSCLNIVAVHQCGILMEVLGRMTAYTSTTSPSMHMIDAWLHIKWSGDDTPIHPALH